MRDRGDEDEDLSPCKGSNEERDMTDEIVVTKEET